MRTEFPTVVVVCGALASGCFQTLDSKAASGMGARDPKATPTTVLEPSHLPIGTNIDDEDETTDDACEKTRKDKTEILEAYCASCHSGPAASGLPKFDFILDDAALISRLWIREGQPAQRFVIPGDPDHSVVYTRVAIQGDMPAQPSDLATPRNPVPSLSDISILREWIAHCAGDSGGTGTPGGGAGGSGGTTGIGGTGGNTGGGVTGSGGGAGPDGGGSGSGGAPAGGSGGSTGTGGGAGSGGGGPGAGTGGAGGATGGGGRGVVGGRGGAAAPCAGTVSGGGVCDVQAQPCQMGGQTSCTCTPVGRGRQWTCG